MFRFFYRYMRRNLHTFSEDKSAQRDIIKHVTKWWFDTARNLMIASLFALFAIRSGSWVAYLLAHFSFVMFALHLFQPVFNFLIRANHSGNNKVPRKRVTIMGMSMFLNVLSLFLGAAYSLIFAVSKLQIP
jgi:hypothetical protein